MPKAAAEQSRSVFFTINPQWKREPRKPRIRKLLAAATARIRQSGDAPQTVHPIISERCKNTRCSPRGRIARGSKWARFFRRLGAVEFAAQSDQRGDHDRHQHDRQNHLGQHLPGDQPGDRADAEEGDGDEDQGVDDLAQDAGDRGADQRPSLLPAVASRVKISTFKVIDTP